ncbi:hypothetical protein MP638_007514 [Amoeboaphelidium occidentale]|nr:hypothetical protein MP638_007514 [Amoeboaphelidium occidentale]
MFCKICGNLLDYPGNSDFVSCNLCNTTHNCSEYEQIEIVTHSRPNAFGKKKAVEEEEEQSGAIIEETCTKCGHNQMRFFTMQLRSSDEGQTVFYTCTKCR